MNHIREWIDQLLASSRKRAALAQVKRQLDERVFLFAIEIGCGRKLTPAQRREYAKTFRTAQVMLLLEEEMMPCPPFDSTPIKNILREPQKEWLLKEPAIKAELESRLKQPLSDLEDSSMSPADRIAITAYLHLIAETRPGVLSPQELESILDRLEHPLDRA